MGHHLNRGFRVPPFAYDAGLEESSGERYWSSDPEFFLECGEEGIDPAAMSEHYPVIVVCEL